MEELSADWRTIKADQRRSKNYIWSKNYICKLKNFVGSADWRTTCRSKNCWGRSKNYIRSKHHILSKNYICRSKNYVRSADRRTTCRSKNYRSRSKKYIQSKNYIRSKNYICRLKNHLPIEELPADRRIIPFADWRMLCRSKNYIQIDKTICRLNNFLQIKFQSVDSSSICRLFGKW